MSAKKPLPALVLNPNSDVIFGPLATAVNGETGTLCTTVTTEEGTFHNANFPKYGSVIPSIPAVFVTITPSSVTPAL